MPPGEGEEGALYARGMSSLRGLTTAQLETMRDNLLAAHAKALAYESAGADGASLKRTSAAEIMSQLQDVTSELAARDDDSGGLIHVEFHEAL